MAGPAAEDVVKDVVKELSERQQIILDDLRSDGTLSAKDLSLKYVVKERTVQRDLAELCRRGLLSREGGRKEGRWIVHD